MNTIQRYSAFTVIVSFVCLALIGLALAPTLPVKQAPESELPQMSVTFSLSDAAPRVVEDEGTCKLEQVLARLDNVRYVNSISEAGSGRVTVGFSQGTDMETARLQAATAIRQIWSKMPPNASYPQISILRSVRDARRLFMQYAVCSRQPLADMQNVLNQRLVPVVGQIKGVKSVSLGQTVARTLTATCDTRQMALLGISLNDVKDAIGSSTATTPLGLNPMTDEAGRHIWMRMTMAVDAADTLNLDATLVRTASGALLPLSSLVHLSDAEDEPVNMDRINGLNTLFVNIAAEPSANQIAVGQQVKDTMSRLLPTLPPTYEGHLLNDTGKTLASDVANTYVRNILTVLILVAFTFISTRNRRLSFVIFTSLVVSLCLAFGAYYLVGMEIHFYSLAGITISLSLMIDNIIVMAYHIAARHNMRAFMPMLAATLTSIGALAIIFFLDDSTRLNLYHFAMAVIVNLLSSLFTATFFVPALMEKTHADRPMPRRWRLKAGRDTATIPPSTRGLRRLAIFSHLYERMVAWLARWRAGMLAAMVLAFGLPVFMLPAHIDDAEHWWQRWYNSTIGSKRYNDHLRTPIDKALGGTLRLFAESVNGTNPFANDKPPVGVGISAHMREGSTLQQMDQFVRRMEAALTQEPGIHRFRTQLAGPNDANIDIEFTQQAIDSGMPLTVHQHVVEQALAIGGGTWSVGGPGDMMFSNDARTSAGEIEVMMRGYNYDQLVRYANDFRDTLLLHPRIKSVMINSSRQSWDERFEELYLLFDKQRLADQGIALSDAIQALSAQFGKEDTQMRARTGHGPVLLVLHPSGQAPDVWALEHMPVSIGGKTFKVGDVATVAKRQAPDMVVKENQEYVLCLQFDYIGAMGTGDEIVERDIKHMASHLPMGYSIERKTYGGFWKETGPWKGVALLALVAVIVLFITAILFNSLRQPLAILLIIPVSFIGVFVAFGCSGLVFGQGGFASLVLLAGISVNSNIYLVNEYNNIRRERPHLSAARAAVKAWNRKVVPILLTIVSTVLGFVPFLVAGDDVFWLSLAVGTTAGLATSLIGSFVCLPIVIKVKR